jgi:hypothetical protein
LKQTHEFYSKSLGEKRTKSVKNEQKMGKTEQEKNDSSFLA